VMWNNSRSHHDARTRRRSLKPQALPRAEPPHGAMPCPTLMAASADSPRGRRRFLRPRRIIPLDGRRCGSPRACRSDFPFGTDAACVPMPGPTCGPSDGRVPEPVAVGMPPRAGMHTRAGERAMSHWQNGAQHSRKCSVPASLAGRRSRRSVGREARLVGGGPDLAGDPGSVDGLRDSGDGVVVRRKNAIRQPRPDALPALRAGRAGSTAGARAGGRGGRERGERGRGPWCRSGWTAVIGFRRGDLRGRFSVASGTGRSAGVACCPGDLVAASVARHHRVEQPGAACDEEKDLRGA
jgi:hypothetical protein